MRIACGKKGHTSRVCRSRQNSGARAVECESDDTDDDQNKEMQVVVALAALKTTEHLESVMTT